MSELDDCKSNHPTLRSGKLLDLVVSSANHDLNVAQLRGVLSGALKRACGEVPSGKTLDTWLIMIKDREVMKMIGVFYMMVEFFFREKQEDMVPNIDRKLDIHELMDLIKSRNDAYAFVTTNICAATNHLMSGDYHHDRLPGMFRGRKWFAVGYDFKNRGSKRDENCEWENEAMSMYKQMVKDSDILKASPKPSLGTRVGKRLTRGFDHLPGPCAR